MWRDYMAIPNCSSTKKKWETQNLCGFQKIECSNKKNPFPLPFIDEELNIVVGCETYSFLDGYFWYHHILYINCVVCLSRVCHVTVMLLVLHFLWQNRPLYINVWKEWTEFSRRVSADHWTQRKVTVRTLVDDRRMESFRRREKCTSSKKRMGVSPSVFVSPLCLPSVTEFGSVIDRAWR